ncbi:MAG: outer membrane beta-barrel protein, partial [Stellaceae bacterium]
MKGLVAGTAVVLALTAACRAADLSITTTSKAGQIGNYDWAGAYVGVELGDAAGPSDWSAAQAGAAAPILTGSLDMHHGFNAFTGTGSYFEGFDAGYNYVFPSHLVLGVEGDLSFPSDISGSQTVSAVSTGKASYSDTVQLFGTARGRIGYAFDKWLVYGTGGFAFSRDQLERAQLSGTPIGGTAVAGDVDTELLTRLGATIGAGVEVGLTPRLSTKLEYRFFDFPSSGVLFPLAEQHYDSDLMLHTVQLGLNYKLGNPGDDQL